MSTDREVHYLARQSYVEAMKDLARRESERQQAFRDERLAALNRYVEDGRKKAKWRQACMENAVRISNSRRFSLEPAAVQGVDS